MGVRGENQEEDDEGEESPLEVHGDQAHPGRTATGLQKHEEMNEQEKETDEKPVEKTHPLVAADGEDTDTPEHLEQEEPVVDADIRVMAGSGEAAEEIIQPQESQLGKNPQR